MKFSKQVVENSPILKVANLSLVAKSALVGSAIGLIFLKTLTNPVPASLNKPSIEDKLKPINIEKVSKDAIVKNNKNHGIELGD